MTKAERMILDLNVRAALGYAGAMCAAMDDWIRYLSRGEYTQAGGAFSRMMHERERYDRAMVALTEARNAGS